LSTKKRLRSSLVTLAAVIGSLLAVGAAPAFASPHWSDTTHGAKAAGSLTVTKGALNATCTAPTTGQIGSFYGGEDLVIKSTNSLFEVFAFNCGAGKKLELMFQALTTSTSTIRFGESLPEFAFYDPWGQMVQEAAENVKFVNGSGSTPSKIVFEKTTVGAHLYEGSSVQVSGSLNITTSTGGLLTILP
jgi:hypothetical protein